jgi:hypothetical protein
MRLGMAMQRYCKFCGAELVARARFCASCGERVLVDAAPETMNTLSDSDAAVMAGGSRTLTWLGDYPVVRNKTVAISILAVTTISVGLTSMFVIGLAVHDGNYDFLLQLVKIFAGIWFGVTLSFFLIGELVFGKLLMEVIIDDQGVTQIQRSKRARALNAAAVVGGLLTGGSRGASTAGAGMLAASRQTETYRYRDLRYAKGNPRTGEIRLWDDWHTVMQLFAPLERYEETMNRIESGLRDSARNRAPLTDIPTAVKALVSFGALVCGAFLLAGFPLAFSAWFVLPMVALTLASILSHPPQRHWLGWGLACGVAISVAVLFQVNPTALHQEGAGLALGIQLTVIGLFALFGVCAGLGVFTLSPRSHA